MKLTGETKLFFGILVSTIMIIVVASLVMTKPAPTYSRDEMIPKGAHTQGNPDAKIYLVEFSDFQCPACKAAKPYADGVAQQYKDKLLFAYRHFPLESHPFAQKAAQAAEAAAAQGKFWEMYMLLFQNQEKLSDNLFGELAKQLGLDEKKFTDELAAGTYAQTVQNDRSDGLRFGVAGTPTFFLNGKKLELSSFEDIRVSVEKAIQETN